MQYQFLTILRMIILLPAFAGLLATGAYGQGRELTPTFQFRDGLYLAFSDFQADQPAITADSLEGQWVLSDEGMILQVADLRIKGGDPVDLSDLWGICLDGIPYLALPAGEHDKPLPAFAALRLVGNICYYRYETVLDSTLTMPVYNPLTGQPFRKSKVNRQFTVVKEKLLRFADGSQADFGLENLLEWMADDPAIVRALREQTGSEELEEQLYRALISYNRRHPQYIEP